MLETGMIQTLMTASLPSYYKDTAYDAALKGYFPFLHQLCKGINKDTEDNMLGIASGFHAGYAALSAEYGEDCFLTRCNGIAGPDVAVITDIDTRIGDEPELMEDLPILFPLLAKDELTEFESGQCLAITVLAVWLQTNEANPEDSVMPTFEPPDGSFTEIPEVTFEPTTETGLAALRNVFLLLSKTCDELALGLSLENNLMLSGVLRDDGVIGSARLRDIEECVEVNLSEKVSFTPTSQGLMFGVLLANNTNMGD